MNIFNENKKFDASRHERKIESLVVFKIADTDYYLPKGYYLVSDLKRIAGVPESHILAEIGGDEIDALTDDTVTHISGCEEFKPFPGKGDAS